MIDDRHPKILAKNRPEGVRSRRRQKKRSKERYDSDGQYKYLLEEQVYTHTNRRRRRLISINLIGFCNIDGKMINLIMKY